MASRSSVEKITCVCGEVVLSFRNRNYLKVVLAGKMLVLSRRLREAQGMDNSYPVRACAARGYVIGCGVYILYILLSTLFGTNLLSPKILTFRGLL